MESDERKDELEGTQKRDRKHAKEEGRADRDECLEGTGKGWKRGAERLKKNA